MLAILDAGISLSTTLVSISCVMIQDDEDNQILVMDPDSMEEKCGGTVYCVFDGQIVAKTGQGGLVSTTTNGLLNDQAYQSCLMGCRIAAKSMFAFLRITMDRKQL